MRESVIEQYLKYEVTIRGGTTRKVNWVNHCGAPDRLVLFAGFAIWVELKRPGEKPRPNQVREHKELRKAGQTVVVLDSVLAVTKWLIKLDAQNA